MKWRLTERARARKMLGLPAVPKPDEPKYLAVYTPRTDDRPAEEFQTVVARCDECPWVETRTYHRETMATTDLAERWTEGAMSAHAREAHGAVL